METSQGFPGFTSASFDFFQDLSKNNNKPWFDQERVRYEEHIVGVFRGLLDALRPFLSGLNPHFEVGGKTNGNFSRINRDIRFSKDKTPYKQNYYLYAFEGRHDRGHGGRLYVGLSPDCVTVGFSIYGGEGRKDRGALAKTFRKRVVRHPRVFARLLERVVRAKHYETYWHRLEKGEWAQHAGLPRRREDWQTLEAWIVRKVFLPNARGLATPGFAGRVQEIFSELYPLWIFTTETSPKWQSALARHL